MSTKNYVWILFMLFFQFFYGQTTNILSGSGSSGHIHLSGVNHTFNVPISSGYCSPSGSQGAVIDFNYAMQNFNNRMWPGCCNGNSSPLMTVTLYVNNRIIWQVKSPNDDNVESGDFAVYSGATLLQGPGVPWDMSKYSGDLRHRVRIRLPYFSEITSVKFTFVAGEDDANIRVNSIYAGGCNTAPIARDDNYTTCSSSNYTDINVLGNDYDSDGDNLKITNVYSPSNGGSASVVNNKIRYYPPSPARDNTIKYRITDGNGAYDTAILYIYQDASPNAGSNGNKTVSCSSRSLNLRSVISGEDVGGTWTRISGEASGISSFNTSNSGAITFTSTASGTYKFKYTVTGSGTCSGQSDTSIATLTVATCCDTPPNAGTDGNGTVTCNSRLVNLKNLISGEDAGGEWTRISGAASGLSSFNTSSGAVTFTDEASGTYEFRYTVTGTGTCSGVSDTSDVTLTVNACCVNFPEAGSDGSTIYSCNQGTISLDTYLSGADSGGVWSLTSGSSSGLSDFNTTTGAVSFTEETVGTYVFTYTVNGTGACSDEEDSSQVSVSVLGCCDAVADPSLPDTDGDGIADACDLDNDNDGIPDSIECSGSDSETTTEVAYYNASRVVSENSINGGGGAAMIGSDNVWGNMNSYQDYVILDLGRTVPAGEVIRVESFMNNGTGHKLGISTSATTSNFTNEQSYSYRAMGVEETQEYAVTTPVRYVRIYIAYDNGAGSLRVDNVSYSVTTQVEVVHEANISLYSSTGSPTNNGYAPGYAIESDNRYAKLNTANSDNLIINLGDVYPAGTLVHIESMSRDTGNVMRVESSTSSNSNYDNAQTYTFSRSNVEEDKVYQLSSEAQYIKITMSVRSSGNVSVDAVTVEEVSRSCDIDGDGIPNHLDLDSDGDGCPDAIEAGINASYLLNDETIDTNNYTVGNNGLADVLETSADSGAINYDSSSYNTLALDASVSNCEMPFDLTITVIDDFTGIGALQAYSGETFDLTLELENLEPYPSDGTDIVVTIPINRSTSLESYNSGLTQHTGVSVNNSDWEIDTTTSSFFINFIYRGNSGIYPANGVSRIGLTFKGSDLADGQIAQYFLIQVNSGGDANSSNNTAYREIVFIRR